VQIRSKVFLRKLLTVRQTDKQRRKHNLPGGGNDDDNERADEALWSIGFNARVTAIFAQLKAGADDSAKPRRKDETKMTASSGGCGRTKTARGRDLDVSVYIGWKATSRDNGSTRESFDTARKLRRRDHHHRARRAQAGSFRSIISRLAF